MKDDKIRDSSQHLAGWQGGGLCESPSQDCFNSLAIAQPGEDLCLAQKSYNAQSEDSIDQSWFIVDGEDQIVGRIASDIAVVLMGKHKPTYTPNVDTGDFVIVTNCEKIKFSGNKLSQKKYTWYTGYTGLRSETAQARLNRKPEQIMRDAVRRMLPKNKIGRVMLSKLKIYVGNEHPHQAQNPQPLTGGRTLK